MDFRSAILADMECFLYKGEVKEWLKQVDTPYFFMRFNPDNKTITFCRWGYSKRLVNSDARLWFRIDSRNIKNNLYAGIGYFERLWSNFSFDSFRSEPVPDLLPNTKFADQKIILSPLRQVSMI
jgi:hypothetical protein